MPSPRRVTHLHIAYPVGAAIGRPRNVKCWLLSTLNSSLSENSYLLTPTSYLAQALRNAKKDPKRVLFCVRKALT